MTNALRTFASKPYVIVTDVGVVGAFALASDARAEAYRMAQYDRPRVVDLSDIAAFLRAAINAGDEAGAKVARIALRSKSGKSRRQVAAWILGG